MRKNTTQSLIVLILSAAFIFSSCQKSIDKQADFDEIATAANTVRGNGVVPYKFERINIHNFSSQAWREQQVSNLSTGQVFSDESDYVSIVCGPENTSDPRLINGCITMNLPTSADPTLRRIRLRKSGYSGTRLADLTELKYSTYVVNNAPVTLGLTLDVTGDDQRDFGIWFEPRQPFAGPNIPPFLLNTWQQWNTLDGIWHSEGAIISGVPEQLTIAELVTLFPNARIIDTPPVGHSGEGIRFTIGGTPRSLFDNTIGYLDALIIGTKNEQHSTLYDFMCDQSGN